MEDDHRDVYERSLCILQSRLNVVVSMLKSLVKPQPSQISLMAIPTYSANRAKYAIRKDSLDSAIDELELWQRTADQSWFLLMKILDPWVDSVLAAQRGELKPSTTAWIPSTAAIRAGLLKVGVPDGEKSSVNGITLESDALKKMDIHAIPFGDGITVATRSFSDGHVGVYILDKIRCHPSKYQTTKRNARDLVRKLQHDEPHTFGLLNCKGFIPELKPTGPEMDAALTLVFRSPPDSYNPKSLRDLLINTPSSESISRRLELARDVAKSVGYIHTFGFVHKSVRPESILVFELANSSGRSAFLAGFEGFRRDEGWTQRQSDDAPDKNIYRHASRQGFNPRDEYEMQHDIYSLGVCLLEIGLWGSFVEHSTANGARYLSSLLKIPPEVTASRVSTFLIEKGKDHLVSLARSQLPGSMGDKYAEIVETCLTCLDPANADFGDEREFEDEYGIRVGARYIEKVRP